MTGCLTKCVGILLLAVGMTAQAGVYEDMMRAIELEDERGVGTLLKRGVDVDTIASDGIARGDTLLMIAARKGSVPLVKTLLSARPKINARNVETGETALMLAAFHGHPDVVRLLLAQGAEVNHSGWTPLIYASARNRLDIARILVKQGAQVNAQAGNGTTPLMMAAREGHLPMVLFLLEQGAEINRKNEDGVTALKLAQDRGFREVSDILTRAGGTPD